MAWDEIPDSWTATAMLRNMAADHLGPDKSFDGPLDEETRERMVVLAILGHLEVAEKVATIGRLIQQIIELLPQGSDGRPDARDV